MTTRFEMLDAIAADPADDTVRLAFADLLDESPADDVDVCWASLIRHQIVNPGHAVRMIRTCRTNNWTYAMTGRDPIKGWTVAKIGQVADRIVPGPYISARDASEVEIRRGFAAEVRIPESEFYRGAPRSAWHAIPVTVWNLSDKMPALCRGGFRWVRGTVPRVTSNFIAGDLYDHLCGGVPIPPGVGRPYREYASTDDAYDDLIAACRKYVLSFWKGR